MGKRLNFIIFILAFLLCASLVHSAPKNKKIIFVEEGDEFIEPADQIPKSDPVKKPSVYETFYDTKSSTKSKKSVYEQLYKPNNKPVQEHSDVPADVIPESPLIPDEFPSDIEHLEPPQLSSQTQTIIAVVFTLFLAVSIKYILLSKPPISVQTEIEENSVINATNTVSPIKASPVKVSTSKMSPVKMSTMKQVSSESKSEVVKESKEEQEDEGGEVTSLIVQNKEKTNTTEFKKNISKEGFEIEMIAHSGSVLSSIDPKNLSEKHKLHYVETTLKLTKAANDKKKLELEEAKRKEKEKKFLYKEDTLFYHNLLLLTCIVLLFVWGISLKMVVSRVLTETLQDWSDLFYYSIESLGVLPPTKKYSSWGWVNPFEKFANAVHRIFSVGCILIGVIILVVMLIKLPRFGFVCVIVSVLHTCWRSLLRLGFWSLPLVVLQYVAVTDLSTRFPSLSKGRGYYKLGVSVVSLIAAVGVGMAAARGDFLNPYRKVQDFELFIEWHLSEFVNNYFY